MNLTKGSSEDYYGWLTKELENCLNDYQVEKHQNYLEKATAFETWCSHQYNDETSAIESGIDQETNETWSQCKFCKKNMEEERNQ